LPGKDREKVLLKSKLSRHKIIRTGTRITKQLTLLFSNRALAFLLFWILASSITFYCVGRSTTNSVFGDKNSTFNVNCDKCMVMSNPQIEKLEVRQNEKFPIGCSTTVGCFCKIDDNSYNHNIIKNVSKKYEYNNAIGGESIQKFTFQALSVGSTNLEIIIDCPDASTHKMQYQIKVVGA
jgi:hypothetical protein